MGLVGFEPLGFAGVGFAGVGFAAPGFVPEDLEVGNSSAAALGIVGFASAAFGGAVPSSFLAGLSSGVS